MRLAMARYSMAANARPVDVLTTVRRPRARRSSTARATGGPGADSFTEVDEHGHGVEPHHVLRRTAGLDGGVHVVAGWVRVAPEDIGERLALALQDEVG